MDWIKITDIPIPKTQVMAINKQDDCLVGYLNYSNDFKTVECQTEDSTLEDITHYMIIVPPERN